MFNALYITNVIRLSDKFKGTICVITLSVVFMYKRGYGVSQQEGTVPIK